MGGGVNISINKIKKIGIVMTVLIVSATLVTCGSEEREDIEKTELQQMEKGYRALLVRQRPDDEKLFLNVISYYTSSTTEGYLELDTIYDNNSIYVKVNFVKINLYLPMSNRLSGHVRIKPKSDSFNLYIVGLYEDTSSYRIWLNSDSIFYTPLNSGPIEMQPYQQTVEFKE